MQSTKQQQILGYFIEEAKEHLDTIERGLLDLQATMADAESMNELFRAAHSVKGGAAMLGFNSIQQTAHHLEDCFKILKDRPVKVDEALETLFLKGFDTLKDLLEGLQSPYGLRDEDAAQIIKESEPTFAQLVAYLHSLTQVEDAGVATLPGAGLRAAPAQKAPTPAAPSAAPQTASQLMTLLKQMLQLFKQGESAKGRQQLVEICDRLSQLHRQISPWQALVQTARNAISNPKYSYQTLAPIVIRDFKLASDLLVAGKGTEIATSQALKALVESMPAAPAAPAARVAPARPIPLSVAAKETVQSNNSKQQQILITLDPKAAAKTLVGVFNKDQLVELADLILRSIQ